MEFQHFLKALEHISIKLYPTSYLEEAFITLIEEFILKLEIGLDEKRTEHSNNVRTLMEMLKDEDVISVLTIVHRIILPYYTYYADSKGFMNFASFVKFCRDFSLFPDLVSKPKLMKFFYTLSGIQKQNEQELPDRAPD